MELKDKHGWRAIDYAKRNEKLEYTDALRELSSRSKSGIAIEPGMLLAFILLLAITGAVSTGKSEGKFGKYAGKVAKLVTIIGVVSILVIFCYLICLYSESF